MGEPAFPPTGRAAVWTFALALGACAVVAQSVLVRELSLLWFGSELSIGMTLACWLLGVSAGAAAGGALGRRLAPEPLAAAGAVLLAACLPLALWLLRGARGWLAPGPGEFIPLPQMLAATAVAAGGTGLLVGALFPPGCALAGGASPSAAGASPTQARRAIGRFFVAEAVGMLLAGAAFTFWWVGRVDPFSLWSYLAGAMLLALAWAGAGAQAEAWRRPARAIPAGLTACAVALLACGLAGPARRAERASLQRRWADLAAAGEHVAGGESPFARLDLGRLAGQWTLYANCQPAGTFPNRIDTAPYVHLAACQPTRLRRALVLGESAAELAGELARYPNVEVEFVQLDRVAADLLAAHVRPTPAGPTRFADGRQFLRGLDRPYDLVLLAPGDPTSIAGSRFYTRQFFRLVRDRLSDGGVLALALPGPAERITPPLRDFLGSVYLAAEDAFAETLWTWGDPVYVFAAGGAGVLTADTDELIARYRARPGPEPFDPEYFLTWREDRLQPARLAELRAALERTDPALVNTDDRPTAMFLSLRRHEQIVGGALERPGAAHPRSLLALLGRLRARAALAAVAAAGGCVCALVGWQRLRRRRRAPCPSRLAVLFSLGATGLAGMALTIVLLAAFQNLYGYVYSHIAMITATYMAGVALGALLPARHDAPDEPVTLWRRLVRLDGALCLGCLVAPLLLEVLASIPATTDLARAGVEGAILLLLLLAGLAGGLAVPLSAGLYASARAADPAPATDTAGVAGAVDAADCLGGSVGALTAGVVLLPVLGVTWTCLLAATLKLSSLGALLAGGKPRPRY